MKKALVYIVLLDLLFVIMLFFSGLFSGIVGDVIYYFAFLLPTAVAICIAKGSDVKLYLPSLKISSRNLLLTLPTVAPTLAVIFLISWLTSVALSRFGGESTPDVSGNIFLVIFTHAFLTAVLEEALFRYAPLALLLPHSRRVAVLASAILFALVHCNIYQIPYAFAAGVIFAVLDIAFDSIIPSFIIHFLNNVISIIWLKGGGDEKFVIAYILILMGAAAVSVIPIIILRKKYASAIALSFEKSAAKNRDRES